ncbi:Gfo/Idh/MocA family oxidoreductase [Cytophaga sp. FL35]|uniref:Gfo/Idh/MocA family protein n=1 Tax=Cytophaga sp. FL35 TaxID=1904456 RepID=UPI001653A6F4|nr:Gfo/Idh/MocA family oxidoreductase [Cytophaga sp. FL35]MBC6998926.1 Gfo/Idh/MocA family oxidoreductase [Cytophaga sp. FL35]
MKILKWGILGTATIAVEQLIPALLMSEFNSVIAIASRNKSKAKLIGERFRIPTCFGAYEKVLDMDEIEAVYIPLPNHLHVEWAIKALQKGKHVLLEKPVGMNAQEANALMEASVQFPQLKIMEAFMYRFHPQWIKVRQLINNGFIGKVTLVESSFSFFEDNPKSIVNSKECGGGSLMDVGCYPISVARLIFREEPISVMAQMEVDPKLQIDASTSGILEFKTGRALIHSSIRQFEKQSLTISGEKGSIEVAVPFNPEADWESNLILKNHEGVTDFTIERCNQYVLQVDSFALSVRNKSVLPIGLKESVANMKVIDALKESHQKQRKIYLS